MIFILYIDYYSTSILEEKVPFYAYQLLHDETIKYLF